MGTVAGIFRSRADAERAAESLRSIGIASDKISFLTPGTSEAQLEAAVQTTETEQPGMGGALGGTVGAAMGAAGGASIGAVLASLLVPGVGPVLAAGVIGAALLGAGGAAAGAAAGSALEESIEGLPHDELYIYEDALRKGRSVVFAITDDDDKAEAARNMLAQGGAESVDAAREDWWVGLRGAEEEEYTSQGRDFKKDEPVYRRGFEAAQHARFRGRSYDDAIDHLRELHKETFEAESFRRGYERGQGYHKSLRERDKG